MHKLFLVIELPEVSAIFKILSAYEVSLLLNKYNIKFIPLVSNRDKPISNTDLNNIKILIENRITELENDVSKMDNTINTLESIFDPDVNINVLLQTIDEYFDDLIKAMMVNEDNDVFYSYTLALIADTVVQKNLVTSDTLQLMLFNEIREFIQGRDLE